MKKIVLILSVFLHLPSVSSASSPEISEIASRLRQNRSVFKVLHPLMAHPRRAGQRDPYKIYYPKNYLNQKSWPLVVLLHGIYVSGDFQDHFFGLKKRVSKMDFVLLIPGSTYDQKGVRFWNAGKTCCDYFNSGVDDVAYLENLIKKIKTENKIDPAKITIIGHSNGSMMAQRLACDAENLVTKVIAYSGVSDSDFVCKNKTPFKLLLIHDKDDERILFNGMSDLELSYRLERGWMYPMKAQYSGAVKNYERWKAFLPEGYVELKATSGRGHMPKLSRYEKDRLVDLVTADALP